MFPAGLSSLFPQIVVFISATIVREEYALASAIDPLFPSQSRLRWATTSSRSAPTPANPTYDAYIEQHPHLCRRRRLPGERRDLSRGRTPRRERDRGRGQLHSAS